MDKSKELITFNDIVLDSIVNKDDKNIDDVKKNDNINENYIDDDFVKKISLCSAIKNFSNDLDQIENKKYPKKIQQIDNISVFTYKIKIDGRIKCYKSAASAYKQDKDCFTRQKRKKGNIRNVLELVHIDTDFYTNIKNMFNSIKISIINTFRYYFNIDNYIISDQDKQIINFIKKKNNEVNPMGYFIVNKQKYRLYVELDDLVKQNCKFLYNKIKNYPFEKEIRQFGEYFINVIVDIKSYTKFNKYFIKSDIKYAYASVSLNILFDYLVEDKYFKENLTFEEFDYIKQIYHTKYNFKNKIVIKPELYLGISLSTMLYQIYMNMIIKRYKQVCSSKILIFVDDILLYGNDLEILKRDYDILKKILKLYNLDINIDKTKFIDVNKDSLIFLNRIIISNNDEEEQTYLEKYVKNNELIINRENLDLLFFMDLNKFTYNNIDSLKILKKKILSLDINLIK